MEFRVVLLAAAIAGCLQGPGPSDAAALEPPTWQVGDWWSYEFHHVSTGEHHEITLVVAAVDEEAFHVGVPVDGELPEAFHAMLITHLPFFGDVGRDRFDWDAHERRFAPLDFPLVEDKEWMTRWMSGGDLTATVTSVRFDGAHVRFDGDWRIDLDYDAGAQAIGAMVVHGYASMHLVDHGTGFVGDVMVPANHEMIWYEGRHLAFLDRDDAPALAAETLTMPEGHDAITFALITGLTPYYDLEMPAGAFRIQVEAPDGTTWQQDASGIQQGRPLTIHHHDAVPGDWTLTMLAAGTGRAAMEAFVYDRWVVAVGESKTG